MSSRAPRRSLRILTPSVLLVLVLVTACGKKGAPLPPLRWEPAPIADLVVRQQGDELLLEASYPLTTLSGLPLAAITAVEVWKIEIPVPDDPEPLAEELSLEAREEEEELEIREDELAADKVAADSVMRDSEFRDDPVIEALEAADRRAGGGSAAVETPEESVSATLIDELEPSTEDLQEIGESLPTTARARGPRLISDRAFKRGSENVETLEELELASAIRGSRLVLRLPLVQSQDGEKVLLGLGLRTVNDKGKPSPMSNIATLVPVLPSQPPTDLRLGSLEVGVQISWKAPEEIPDGYSIYRRRSEEPFYAEPIHRIERPTPPAPPAPSTATPPTESSSPDTAATDPAAIAATDPAAAAATDPAAAAATDPVGIEETDLEETDSPAEDSTPTPAAVESAEPAPEPATELESPTPEALPEVPLVPPDTQMVDTGAAFGERYVYTVRSFRFGEPVIESAVGEELELEYLDVFSPSPPTGVLVLPESAGARVLWRQSSSADVIGYFVESIDLQGTVRRANEEPTTRLELVVSGLENRGVYDFQVIAVDAAGNESVPSEKVNGRTL